MKYFQNGTENLNMEIDGEFIGRRYHIKVMDNLQDYNSKKMKRYRSAFTTDQINYLEQQFKKCPYIGNAQRKEVAATLNISDRAVKIWFQNRRMKEKKESSTKEVDDEQGIRKYEYLESTKDQLNNMTASSTNEQPRTFTLLTHLSQGHCYSNIEANSSTSSRQCSESRVSAEKPVTCSFNSPNVATTAKVIHPPPVFVKSSIPSPDFKTTAEFSIELCKKYKSELLPKQSSAEVQTFKKETESKKKLEEPKPVVTEQVTPEDLSLSRKMNKTTMDPQPTPGNASSHPGFVSLVPTVPPFYTQPYVPGSGVIWKPLSVMPVVNSNSPPVSAVSNPLLNMPPVQANLAKKSCNCDCHVSQATPQVSYTITQQSSNPQYIVTAVPFQNTNPKF